jgi:fatty acid desaturase
MYTPSGLFSYNMLAPPSAYLRRWLAALAAGLACLVCTILLWRSTSGDVSLAFAFLSVLLALLVLDGFIEVAVAQYVLRRQPRGDGDQ